MITDMRTSHLFAIYLPSLAEKVSDGFFRVKDKELHTRISSILRLEAGEQVQFFDGSELLLITLATEMQRSKDIVIGQVLTREKLSPIMPGITLYQAVTKKNAFEDIVYSAAQMGVDRIVPLKTSKSNPYEPREVARLEKIMIAACEQSKQFCLPTIAPLQALSQLVTFNPDNHLTVLFDADGQSFNALANNVSQQKPSHINVFIGPEAGLTAHEIAQLAQLGAKQYRLTPSILRAKDAAAIALGSLRALIA